MELISFIVPGKPQGKARARTGYNPIAKRITSYTPENTVLYENLIKMCYQSTTAHRFDYEVPLSLKVTAYFEPTKSESKKRRLQMLQGQIAPLKKPDTDNIVKAVMDALNGLAYEDDKQVVHLEVFKRYGEQARIEVEIKAIAG